MQLAAVGADGLGEGQRIPDRPVVRTVPVAEDADLLALLPSPAAIDWIRHGAGLVGWARRKFRPMQGALEG